MFILYQHFVKYLVYIEFLGNVNVLRFLIMLSCACFWSTNTLTHTSLLFIFSANTRVWGRFPTTWCNETFLQNYNTLGQVRAAAKCPEYSRRTPRGFLLECGEISTLSSEIWHRSLSVLCSLAHVGLNCSLNSLQCETWETWSGGLTSAAHRWRGSAQLVNWWHSWSGKNLTSSATPRGKTGRCILNTKAIQ